MSTPMLAADEIPSNTTAEKRTIVFADCRSWYHETYPLLFPHLEGTEEVHDPAWCKAYHKALMQSEDQRPDFFIELLDDPADYCQRLRLKYKDELSKLGRPKPSKDAPKSKTCEESTATTQAIVAQCSNVATSLHDDSFTSCFEREAVETHQLDEPDVHMLMFLWDSWPSSLDPLFVWSQRIAHLEFTLTCWGDSNPNDLPTCIRES